MAHERPWAVNKYPLKRRDRGLPYMGPLRPGPLCNHSKIFQCVFDNRVHHAPVSDVAVRFIGN